MSTRALVCALAAVAAMPLLPAQSQALSLTTGIDGGVSYPFDARMVPPTGITVEAWITYDDATIPTGLYYWPTIARQNVTPGQESWNLRVSAANTGARNLQFIVRASNNALYSASYNFVAGEFLSPTHIAATFDGTTIKLFKNGVQVGTGTVPVLSEVADNGGELRIGNGDPVAPGREAWNGTIDEVRIWPMARSAGEIAAGRDQEIFGLTGGVLRFSYDLGLDSEDGTVVGTAFGTVAQVPQVATLTPIAPNVLPLALPSSTCTRKPEMLVGSVPQIGNLDFTFWCVRGPLPTVSPAGAIYAATAPAPIGQPQLLGLDIAFDIGTIAAVALLAPPTNALGNSWFTLPIPNQSALIGAGWVFQFAFLDPQCGPQGISSSNGVWMTIQ